MSAPENAKPTKSLAEIRAGVERLGADHADLNARIARLEEKYA